MDIIPIVGNVKSPYEATVGKDPITGHKLSKTERVTAGISAFLGGGFKGGTKVVSGVVSGGKTVLGKVPLPKGEVDKTYNRPSGFRKGIRDKAWEEAKGADGKVRDPVTKKVMNKEEAWDMGHKPGFEFRKHQKKCARKRHFKKTIFR